MSISRLKSLFETSDEGVEGLAAEIQGAPEGLSQITGAEWLEIFGRTDKPAAIAAACAIAAEHMPPTRLTLEQCVDLACRDAAPVAELGLKLAQMKPLPGSAAVLAVARLGHAPHADVRQDGVRWVVQVLERSPHSKLEHLRELLCAPFEDARRRGAAAMTRSLRFKDALELWITLARSPHRDVRSFLLLHLTRRKSGLTPGSLKHLWATTMIALAHVQGEVKRAVIERLNHYAEGHPEDAATLLPLYEIAGVAPPSPREPEGGS